MPVTPDGTFGQYFFLIEQFQMCQFNINSTHSRDWDLETVALHRMFVIVKPEAEPMHGVPIIYNNKCFITGKIPYIYLYTYNTIIVIGIRQFFFYSNI